MKTALFLILLLWTSSLQAAFTVRYVNDAGSGAADGTSEANAMSLTTFIDYMVTGGSFTAAAGDWFKLDNVSFTSRTTTTDTWVNGGSSTSPVIVEGYGTTAIPSDFNAGRTNGNQALVTTNFPTLTYTTGRLVIQGTFTILRGVNVTSAANGVALDITGNNSFFRHCKVTNSGTGASSVAVRTNGTGSAALDSDLYFTGASGGGVGVFSGSGANCRIKGCRVTGNNLIPGIVPGSTCVVAKNTVFGCTVGIAVTSTGSTADIDQCTVTGNTSDGINIVTGLTNQIMISETLCTDNGGYGVNGVSAGNSIILTGMRYRNNTLGETNSATDWIAGTNLGAVRTDFGTDFINAAGNDYRLNPSSPARAAATLLYQAIGALQPAPPSVVVGGAGTTTITP